MDAYKPDFPSPLNPHAPPQRRDVRIKQNVSISPAQRLLRYKAAEAWRSYVLLQEAREYEKLLMEKIALREGMGKTQQDYIEHVDEEMGYLEEEYQFHLPDLSFFTPRRVVLAMGLMRRLDVGGWLRCESRS